jgi:hypothetical protein
MPEQLAHGTLGVRGNGAGKKRQIKTNRDGQLSARHLRLWRFFFFRVVIFTNLSLTPVGELPYFAATGRAIKIEGGEK